jgi:hypothetical protein
MTIQWAHQPIHHNDPARPWLAPVQPFINNEQPPKPEQPLPEPTPLPTPGNTPVTCNCDLAPVVARLEAIETQLTAIGYGVGKISGDTVTVFPDYTGHVKASWPLGNITFTLTPKEPEQ